MAIAQKLCELGSQSSSEITGMFDKPTSLNPRHQVGARLPVPRTPLLLSLLSPYFGFMSIHLFVNSL